MASDLANTNSDLPSPPGDRRCAYCGATLLEGFYFCPVCATPHRSAESVMPPAAPRQLVSEELILKKVPQVWTLFWIFFSALVGSSILTFVFLPEDSLLGFLLVELVLLITTCVYGALYWHNLRPQLVRPGFTRAAAWIGLAALPVLLGLNYLWNIFLPRSVGMEFGEDAFGPLMQNKGLAILTICVFPAILEEIAFRGLLQHWLHIAVKPFVAIFLASALFSAMHFSYFSFPYLLLVGALLGWTKYKTQSLYPCMVIHFLHNFVVLELFLEL